jgi:hypothetical protein
MQRLQAKLTALKQEASQWRKKKAEKGQAEKEKQNVLAAKRLANWHAKHPSKHRHEAIGNHKAEKGQAKKETQKKLAAIYDKRVANWHAKHPSKHHNVTTGNHHTGK